MDRPDLLERQLAIYLKEGNLAAAESYALRLGRPLTEAEATAALERYIDRHAGGKLDQVIATATDFAKRHLAAVYTDANALQELTWRVERQHEFVESLP